MKKFFLLFLAFLLNISSFAADNSKKTNAAARKNYDTFIARIKGKDRQKMSDREKKILIRTLTYIYKTPRGKKLIAYSDPKLDFEIGRSPRGTSFGSYGGNCTITLSHHRLLKDIKANNKDSYDGLINTFAHEMTHGVFSRLKKDLRSSTSQIPIECRIAENKLDELCADLEGLRVIRQHKKFNFIDDPFNPIRAKMSEGVSMEEAENYIYAQYLARMWTHNPGQPISAGGKKFFYPESSLWAWMSVYMDTYFFINHCPTSPDAKLPKNPGSKDFRKIARIYLDYMDFDLPDNLFRSPESGFRTHLTSDKEFLKTGKRIAHQEVFLNNKLTIELFPTVIVNISIYYHQNNIKGIRLSTNNSKIKAGTYTHEFPGGKLLIKTKVAMKSGVILKYDKSGKLLMKIPFKNAAPCGKAWVLHQDKKLGSTFSGKSFFAQEDRETWFNSFDDTRTVLVKPDEKVQYFSYVIKRELDKSPKLVLPYVKFMERLYSTPTGKKLLAYLPEASIFSTSPYDHFTSWRTENLAAYGYAYMTPMPALSIPKPYLKEYLKASDEQKKSLENYGAMLFAQAIIDCIFEREYEKYTRDPPRMFDGWEYIMMHKIRSVLQQMIAENIRIQLDPEIDTTFNRLYKAKKSTGASDAEAELFARRKYSAMLWQDTPELPIIEGTIKVQPIPDLPLWESENIGKRYYHLSKGYFHRNGTPKNYKKGFRFSKKIIRNILTNDLINLQPDFFFDLENSSYILHSELNFEYRKNGKITTVSQTLPQIKSSQYIRLDKYFRNGKLFSIDCYAGSVKTPGVYNLKWGKNRMEITVNNGMAKLIREITPDNKVVMEWQYDYDQMEKNNCLTGWYIDDSGQKHNFTTKDFYKRGNFYYTKEYGNSMFKRIYINTMEKTAGEFKEPIGKNILIYKTVKTKNNNIKVTLIREFTPDGIQLLEYDPSTFNGWVLENGKKIFFNLYE